MSITPVKSSTNILQEYSTNKYRTLPKYVIKDVSPSIHSPKFQVSVELNKTFCTAEACNKKQAKELCSRMALEELGITHDTPLGKFANSKFDETDNTEDIVNFNAVGALNEYASKHRLPYAEYHDVGTNERGLMIIECTLGQVSAHGLGPNKKGAKKIAAAALLKKLKSTKLINCPTPEKIKRWTSEIYESTTSSTSAIIVKSENTDVDVVKKSTEENVGENLAPHENSAENEITQIEDDIKEDLKDVEIEKVAKAEEEEAMLEDFRVKLSKLGIKDDNNLSVNKNSSSTVLSYRNRDLRINIVRISYDLNQALTDIYENIKEKVEPNGKLTQHFLCRR